MGRQFRPSPVFVVFVGVLALTGGVAGLVSADTGGTDTVDASSSSAVLEDGSTAVDNESPTCERCHGTLPTNTTERDLSNEVTNQPDHEFELDHGNGQWCLACHATEDRENLRLPNGTTVEWTAANETKLCGSCHGTVYADWEDHIHGKWSGSWENATPNKQCTDCHDPHDPEFEGIEPEPAPEDPPSGPAVAQAVLPSGYYVGVGSVAIVFVGLIGYAATGLKND